MNVPSAYTSTPNMDGSASAGSSTSWARGDHRHPSDTSKQATLVSGTNIKTINGNSILGSGDLTVGGGTVDTSLSPTSTNPVENKAVYKGIEEKLSVDKNVNPDTTAYPIEGAVDESAKSVNYNRIMYGDGMYVAWIAGDRSSYGMTATLYSTDGVNWNQAYMPTPRTWAGGCYGNGKFVKVSSASNVSATNSNIIAYSTDAINWTEVAVAKANKQWTKIAYGNNVYVAISSDGYCMYSSDCENWIYNQSPIASGSISSFIYGNNLFVGLGESFAVYSPDGMTWTETSLPVSGDWRSLCYGNNRYIALNYSGKPTVKFLYSDDGMTWTDSDFIGNGVNTVAYGNGKFVAFQTGYTRSYYYSSDGISWTDSGADTLPSPGRNWSDVCYGGNRFVLVSSFGGYGLYSDDGTVWDNFDLPSIKYNPQMSRVIYGNGLYIAFFTKNGNYYLTSTDGKSWSSHSIKWRGYACGCYGHGSYVLLGALSKGNMVYYGSDGSAWTETNLPESRTWKDVCYGNNGFVAVASNSNKGAYSENGQTWIEITLPESRNWTAVCYGNGKYVAVASSSNKFAYSVDGNTWTEGSMPGTYNWYSVCFGNSVFVAVASNEKKGAYSFDGVTWTEMDMPERASWCDVIYGNGVFIASKWDSNTGAYSYDGISWQTISLLPFEGATSNGACFGDNKYIFVRDTSTELAAPIFGLVNLTPLLTQNSLNVTDEVVSAIKPFLAEVPIPTIADAGKVLGVDSNGKLAYISIPQ